MVSLQVKYKKTKVLAERVGFEPTLPFRVNTLSKRAPSATRPSLRRTFGRNDRLQSIIAFPHSRQRKCPPNTDSNRLNSFYGRALAIANLRGLSDYRAHVIEIEKDEERSHGALGARPMAGKTYSRYLSPEQAELARQQIEQGHKFRERVEQYREACEQWADAQLEPSSVASREAAEKGGSKPTFKTKSSRKSKPS
jgi:hypothetical protein